MKRGIALLLSFCLIFTFVAACGTRVVPPDGDKTYYTVTFDIGDEARAAGVTNPSSQRIEEMGTVTKPDISWSGHRVVWYIGDKPYSFSTYVLSDLTLTAVWEEVLVNEYDDGLDEWSESGHLYIHYKRFDHSPSGDNEEVYKPWIIWAWQQLPKKQEGTAIEYIKIDQYGAIYDIDLSKTYVSDITGEDIDVDFMGNGAFATSIGILPVLESTREFGKDWTKDGGDTFIVMDAALREGGHYHFFIHEGATSDFTYTAAEMDTKAFKNPYEDDYENGVQLKKYESKVNLNSSVSTIPVMPTATGYETAGTGYQIFVSTFADSNGDGWGDLNGITQKLDYLHDDLNVDVLWLTPIQHSNNYHGYDILDYYSVDPRFGTVADYRRLVYEAHSRGMKVLMDFVLNHTSPSNPWFTKSLNLVVEEDEDGNKIEYRNFYNWRHESNLSTAQKNSKKWFKGSNNYYYYSSFDSNLPELNFDYQPVRDAILDVAKYWMSFGLDGFRLDAVKHIYMYDEYKDSSGDSKDVLTNMDAGDNNNPFKWNNGGRFRVDGEYSSNMLKNINFFKEFNYGLKSVYPSAFLLGENLDGWSAMVAEYYAGMDSSFNFQLYYNLAAGPGKVAKYDNGVVNYSKDEHERDYGTYNQKRGGKAIDGQFTSNHDLQRMRDRVLATPEGTDWFSPGNKSEADLSKSLSLSKLYVAQLMTLPGLAWIYNGDELGMVGTMENEEIPHSDMVYREPFIWSKTDNSYNAGGFIVYGDKKMGWTGFNSSHIKGLDEQKTDNNSLFKTFSAITAIRKANPTLINGTFASLADGTLNGKGIYAYKMSGTGGTYYCYHNWTGANQSFSGVSGGSDIYKSVGVTRSGSTISLPAYGSIIVKA